MERTVVHNAPSGWSKDWQELPSRSTLPESPYFDHGPLELSREANLWIRLKVVFFGFPTAFVTLQQPCSGHIGRGETRDSDLWLRFSNVWLRPHPFPVFFPFLCNDSSLIETGPPDLLDPAQPAGKPERQ